MGFWLTTLSALVVAALAVGAYQTGYLGEKGRLKAARRDHERQAKKAQEAIDTAAAEARRERDDAARLREAHIQGRRRERIGRRFVCRPDSKTEDGYIITVVDLDDRDLEGRVLVDNTARPGGELPANVPPRLSMEWKALTMSAKDQFHRTAHFSGVDSDADGWLEWEGYRRLTRDRRNDLSSSDAGDVLTVEPPDEPVGSVDVGVDGGVALARCLQFGLELGKACA